MRPDEFDETFEVVTVTDPEEGLRVDAVFAKNCDLSRSRICSLIEDGYAFCDDAPLKKSSRTDGRNLTLFVPPPVDLDAKPEDIPLDVLFEDQHLLVVNKPQGMVVHPAPGNPDGTLVNALLHHCAGRLRHRPDRPL